MAQFLATLHSPLSERGGIGIIDSEYGLLYLQVDNLPGRINSPQLRAMAYHDGCLYITTPSGVLPYKLTVSSAEPVFCQKKGLYLHEWMLGPNLQADLVGILVSTVRKQLLVANNLFNSVDEFTLKGEFVARHFLSKIAPERFPLPGKVDGAFRYGHIRHFSETLAGSVLITVSEMNGSREGCVIDFDTGKVVLNNLHTPHGGLVGSDHFFIQNVSDGLLAAYPLSSTNSISHVATWKTEVESFDSGIRQNLRGMVKIKDSIFCGACHFGKASEQQIPSRIVSFDIATGRQSTTEIFFPDLKEFRQPRVFLLAPLPTELEGYASKGFTFFLNGKSHKAERYTPPQPKEQNDVTTVELKEEVPEQVIVLPKKQEDAVSQPLGQPVISLDKVNLFYRRNAKSLFSFKTANKGSKEYQALCNVTFTLYDGETVGIIGRNGSGKSTISMVISGALPPDNGTVTTNGRVQLLSIGLGFRNELTGRENVFINGALLGLRKKEILAHLPDIEGFAELEEFMDEPVRTYSAGMRSRLGFAVATAVNPDILILDEVMSTGDAAFRKKANMRMEAMRERTKTIVIISHSAALIKKMCSRVVWLNKGQVLMDGEPKSVLSEYEDFCKNPQAWLDENSRNTGLVE